MEARIATIEQQLKSMFQIQKLLVSAFDTKNTLFPAAKSAHVEDLLSEWNGHALRLQSFEAGVEQEAKGEAQPAHGQYWDERIDSGATTPLEEPATTPKDLEQLSNDVLNIIQRYGKHLAAKEEADKGQNEWVGKPMFMQRVLKQIKNGESIKMILPAFPWKSINKVDKVTGILPDLGEELALARLNEMCESIRAIYPQGGEVHIATDGLVFDDVVGILDEDTWAYSEGLMKIVKERGFSQNIHMMRVMDILGYTAGQRLDWDLYSSLVKKCREELLSSYGRTEDEVRAMMKEDSDTLLTYCGFIRFLESDLRHSEVSKTATSGHKYRKCVKNVAINMMIRAESFTKLLQSRCPEYVRLSIHPSTGAVKLSVPLIITGTGEFPRTPWHSSVALALDGSYSTVHSKDVRHTHTLVLRDDDSQSPYYFREKSHLWDDWDTEEVIFEPQYPNKLVVRPRRSDEQGGKLLSSEQIERLQELTKVHTKGPVVVEGFLNAGSVAATAAATAAVI